MSVTTRRLLQLLVALALTLGASTVWAQEEDDEIGSGFNKPDAAEEQRLRRILAAPVPQQHFPAFQKNHSFVEQGERDALRGHFAEKEMAARLLGDAAQREAVMREAARLLPYAQVKVTLGQFLINKGSFDEGNAFKRQSLALASPFGGALTVANIACDLFHQNRNDAARSAVAEVSEKVRAADPRVTNDAERNLLLRALARSAYCLSLLEQRSGHVEQSVQAAQAAEQSGRRALAVASSLAPAQQLSSRTGVADSIHRKISAYRNAGRRHDAEKALADYMRFSTEVQLPANYLAGIYATAGGVRFDQREFAQAEQLGRKADRVLQDLGVEATHPARAGYGRDVFIALAGQRKWASALAEVERLDKLAGQDARLKNRVLFRFERATVYLGNRRYAEAAPLFGRVARDSRDRYGATHFLVAQAAGLQGAALWRSGVTENRLKALPLLTAAVRDYMAPANADFLENIGMRKELRDTVFAAYLEAVASSPGEDATQSIGTADWVRGGSVQEALGDAAVRAAAGTPALADVVRREQDAKLEVMGLRRYLEGESGSRLGLLPGIAASMRARIAELEEDRATLQSEIKTRFPDYARLVRPAPAAVPEIARALEPQQALLMLLPTSEAIYVWAVANDRPAGFVRVSMPESQVDALVTGLRRQLDLANGATVGVRYDSAAAFELYDKLLAPLQRVWQGKRHLIVATGGALSQLPFAVLQTKAGGGADASAPWLIREASITQVPSLSAWLAIKSIANAASASQPFLGWGDPDFGSQSRVASSAPVRSIVLTRASLLADLDQPEKTVAVPSGLTYARMPALPETREELLAIAATLKADAQRDVLLGVRATRDSVLVASKTGELANKRVVAFATHGLMAGDLPNLTQPALAMAATGTQAQDPLAALLTLEDVLTLKLNADWVVLSACNTASTDGKAEEALSGLARGFFYAGSRSLLVTHWAVDSESAKELTTSTFAHYAANPLAPKAESLRQAMLKVMAMPQFSHPAYWAPYALVGDGGR